MKNKIKSGYIYGILVLLISVVLSGCSSGSEASLIDSESVNIQAEDISETTNAYSETGLEAIYGLSDGIYTPTIFSFTGGTGRVVISCSEIIVKDRQTYAKIYFDSPYYTYVSVNEIHYDTEIEDNSASAVIPVQLGKNNMILAMTTRMSSPHEIAYTLYVDVDLSGDMDEVSELMTGDYDALDTEPPKIAGFEYISETELTQAQLFRIYHYDQDVSLLEISMAEDGMSDGITISEADSLYMRSVVKYLLVPQGVEVPAGLEKYVIIVETPISHVFCASPEAMRFILDLSGEDTVTLTGLDKDAIAALGLQYRLEEGLMQQAGNPEEPDFRTLILANCNFAIFSDFESGKLNSPAEKLEELGIIMMLDRSQAEADEAAAKEWIKVYELLLSTP